MLFCNWLESKESSDSKFERDIYTIELSFLSSGVEELGGDVSSVNNDLNLTKTDCVVRPGHIKASSSYDGISMTMDWLPTLAEVAGAAVPEGIEGQSLLSGIQGKNDKAIDSRTLIWVRREGGGMCRGQDYYAVRQGPWKLLQKIQERLAP
jgi:hypothetical protein